MEFLCPQQVHAKLQVLGIATATKILMADDPKIIANLQRNEIIVCYRHSNHACVFTNPFILRRC